MIDKHHAVMQPVVDCDNIRTEQSDSETFPRVTVADNTAQFFGIILAQFSKFIVSGIGNVVAMFCVIQL